MTISDTHSNTGTATDTATVADARLLAASALVATQSGTGGTLVVNNQFVATFVDTGGAEPVANYTATIDWGDGSGTSSGTISLSNSGAFFNVTGGHTYSKDGRYIVTVTIHDEGGAQTTVVSAVASAHTALDVDDAFIEQSYRDVLGRDADPGGLANFANAMQNGMTPATVAGSLVNSDEYRINLIEHAYRAFLGRDADQGGMQAWLGAMRNGLTDQELDADFVGSAEFFVDSGSNNQTFVTELYFDLLGRAPDAAGLAAWVNALNQGASRAQVALGFANSLENENLDVESYYQTFLGRVPSQAEVNAWVNAYQNGATNEQIIADFVGSDEYFQLQTNSNSD